MVYREPGKVTEEPKKDPLFFVVVSYTKKTNGNRTLQKWVRATDSFKALEKLLSDNNVVVNQVWAQGVYSVNDFYTKELEIE